METDLAIDFHMLTLDRTPRALVDRAVASVEAAIARSPIPVHFHLLQGVLGHIGEGRAKGYAVGTSPYVVCMDDDDAVEPHAFEVIAPHLTDDRDAVFPSQWVIMEDGRRTAGYKRHSLIVFKREHLIDHRQWKHLSDLHQNRSLWDKNIVDLDDLLHLWYVRSHSNSQFLLLRDRSAFQENTAIGDFHARATRSGP